MNVAPVVALLLAALATNAAAQEIAIYKCQAEDGTLEYLKAPKPGGECTAVTFQGVPHTERWKHVTTGADGSLVRVDSETIRRDGNKVTAWVQYNYTDKKPYVAGRGFATKTLQREVHSCNAMTISAESYISYDDKNAVLDSGTYLTPSASPIPPDSISEGVWKYLCQPLG